MADYEYSTPHGPEDNPPIGGAYTLTLDAAERQLLQMALGELLQTVAREEHLVPRIRTLLDRVDTLTSAE
ncbi:MAG TPA: hypothetical protein VJN88_14460 [Ktedonobacterales bacterium]|nr:hypothetical protein [Ktedonobacterales bacterium]